MKINLRHREWVFREAGFNQKPDDGTAIRIEAMDDNGEILGYGHFGGYDGSWKDMNGIYIDAIWVRDDVQRKGIATKMCQYAESVTGKTILGGEFTEEGQKFWNQMNRPFGRR